MQVTLINKPTPEVCDFAARMCYGAKDGHKALMSGLEGGHESLLEHATFSFHVRGVSRVLLAQLTRHRIASFSVQSQRYVAMKGGFAYVIPPKIAALGPDAVKRYANQMATMGDWYDEWYELLGKDGAEDARFVLPGACQTELVMTMNIRELRHFLSLRCCNRAQWEIRSMADKILKASREVAPDLFRDAGPGCVRGRCPEGRRSCGKPREELMVRG